MENFLIVLGIYLISVVILHLAAYIYWSHKDKKGSTLNDMYNFYTDTNIYTGIEISPQQFWIPIWNTILFIAAIAGVIVIPIASIICVIVCMFLDFVKKFGNIKIK